MNNICWIWDGAVNDSGYGVIKFEEKFWYIHRLAYTILVDEIPEGYEVDHLCFNPICYNPYHLDAVTSEENKRRQRHARRTHCIYGHPFEFMNGRQICRICVRKAQKKYKEKLKLK